MLAENFETPTGTVLETAPSRTRRFRLTSTAVQFQEIGTGAGAKRSRSMDGLRECPAPSIYQSNEEKSQRSSGFEAFPCTPRLPFFTIADRSQFLGCVVSQLCYLGYWIVNIYPYQARARAIKSNDYTQEQRACKCVDHKTEWQIATVQLGVGFGQEEFVAFGTYNRSKRREKRLREPLDAAALYEYAVRSLGSKMRTVAELKRLMRRRVEADETGEAKVEAVVLRLKELHYLDDTRYASDYTRMRVENEKFGRRRVQQDLIQRGVHEQVIGKTLDAAYSELPEAELARKYIERKRLRKPTNEKETARIVRSLVRAGFSMGTIFPLLKAWKVEESALQAVAEIDLDAPE